MTRMARLLVAISLCALTPALAFATGCGTPKSSTREILEKADRFVNSVDSNVDQLSTDVKALARSIKEGTAITVAMLQQTYDAMKGEAEKVVDSVRSAQLEIKKIVSQGGAAALDRSADIHNEILDNAVALTDTLGDVFTQLSSAMKALSSGTPPDTSGLSRTAEDWVASFEQIKDRSRALVEEARKLERESGP